MTNPITTRRSVEVIDGFKYILDSGTKTATLLPNTEKYAGDKIVILSTHIVSDIEAIADQVLLMKKGKFVLQGTVPELIHKANGKVWELSVSPQEARQWQTKTTVANLRHEGKEIIMRIISDNMPSERAVPCEATLEDLYLFYFPTEEGVK